MKTPVVLDIETIPLMSSLGTPYVEADHSPPANYKNEKTIAEYHERERAAWAEKSVSKASTNPRLGRILAMGYGYDGEIVVDYALEESDERALIEGAWERLAERDGRVVGWNSRGFDMPFLLVRSAILRVQPTLPAEVITDWTRKYNSRYHLDLKLALLDGDETSKEGVNVWCKTFGIPGTLEGMDGSKVFEAYKRGDHDLIKRYLAHDVDAERGIYRVIRPYFETTFHERNHGILTAGQGTTQPARVQAAAHVDQALAGLDGLTPAPTPLPVMPATETPGTPARAHDHLVTM